MKVSYFLFFGIFHKTPILYATSATKLEKNLKKKLILQGGRKFLNCKSTKFEFKKKTDHFLGRCGKIKFLYSNSMFEIILFS